MQVSQNLATNTWIHTGSDAMGQVSNGTRPASIPMALPTGTGG